MFNQAPYPTKSSLSSSGRCDSVSRGSSDGGLQGTFLMPEFAKKRSQRQAGGPSMLQWEQQPQGSNASRRFEITDAHGHTRYHCKPCHMYYLPKCFNEATIQSRTHMCSACTSAVEHGRAPGRHCRSRPFRNLWLRDLVLEVWCVSRECV